MTIEIYREAVTPITLTFDTHKDSRGNLRVLDFQTLQINFVRLFVIDISSTDISRGGHAHKLCWLFAYSTDTGVSLKITNTKESMYYDLTPNFGILIPPYNWTEVHFKSVEAKLNVLASQPYDITDYIYERP